MRRARAGAVAAAVALAAVAAPAPPARAEPFVDLYTGISNTLDGDVRIRQGAGATEFTVRRLSFAGDALESRPWYGVRAGYFFESAPWLGLAVEHFHFKLLGETRDPRRISGIKNGASIETTDRVDSVVQRFDLAHGVNYVTVDVLARLRFWEDDDDDAFPHGRLHVYVGIGAGAVITRAKTVVDGVEREPGYEHAGFGVQAFAGVRVLLFRHLGLFVEGKVTQSRLAVGVAGGGEGRFTETSYHAVGGITIPFP